MEKFSASRAARHMACHASANLPMAIPNWVPPEEDPNADTAANRGTKMHELFAMLMALPLRDAGHMEEALRYVNTVRQGRRFKSLIEVSVQASWLVGQPYTTADLVLYTQDELHIFDLKTGQIPVSAVENAQLMYYAITYGLLAPRAKGAYLHIVQPWAGVMECWFADAPRLGQFMQDAQTHELQIRQGSITFGPSDSCQFCPANPHGRGARGAPLCPIMMELLYPRVDVDEDEILKGD